jgi:carboxylesterase
MRFLGDRLHRRGGFTVRGIRLPGHGTSVEDLDRTTWTDWAASVDQAIDDLRRRCRTVAVVGQSLGGLLVLHAAARRDDLAAVATCAAPLALGGLAARAARWTQPGGFLHPYVRSLPKVNGSDCRDTRARRGNLSYDALPVAAVGQLLDFMGVVDGELPKIQTPLLVLHARRDHTAPVASAARIAERARARRIRILERSFHLITIDLERDIVAAEVSTFFAAHAES